MITSKEAFRIAKESDLKILGSFMYDWPDFYVIGNDAFDYKIDKRTGKVEIFENDEYVRILNDLDSKFGEDKADEMIKKIDISKF